MRELEKYECVSSVMTIAPELNIDIEKMGDMGILMIVDDGTYVCICAVYSSILKNSHKMNSYMTVIFQQNRRVKAVVKSLIINHIHPSV